MDNVVNTFYQRQAELIAHLLNAKELSLAQDAEEMLQKNLPLAAASFFEHQICHLLRVFVAKKTHSCEELISFFEQKAINRQYHALFEWERPNANKFFAHFGEDFKQLASKAVAGDTELTRAMKDFLELGNIRNQIVHKNYADFRADKSSTEVYRMFVSACDFVRFLESELASRMVNPTYRHLPSELDSLRVFPVVPKNFSPELQRPPG